MNQVIIICDSIERRNAARSICLARGYPRVEVDEVEEVRVGEMIGDPPYEFTNSLVRRATTLWIVRARTS
jgi:hypothetical protein